MSTITISRTDAIEAMYAAGFNTAGALSTARLQKKINRLDKVPINFRGMEEQKKVVLDFLLEAINNCVEIRIKEDRPNIPDAPIQPQKQTRKVQRFDRPTARYDWDKILNGSIVELEQGTDYTCKSNTIGMMARKMAKSKGLSCRVKVMQGKVILQAIKRS